MSTLRARRIGSRAMSVGHYQDSCPTDGAELYSKPLFKGIVELDIQCVGTAYHTFIGFKKMMPYLCPSLLGRGDGRLTKPSGNAKSDDSLT